MGRNFKLWLIDYSGGCGSKNDRYGQLFNGTVANQGKRVDLNPILKITDYKNNILEPKEEPDPVQVLDPGIAYILSKYLADNKARAIEFGLNSELYIPDTLFK